MTHHILSIHAHPDDAEILATGTLALLAQNGHQVTIVSMTPGDCGSLEHGPEEIACIRRNEGRAAAEKIGAAYECAEFRDLAIFVDDPSRRRVVELIRRLRPTIILTSSPIDYHCDHEATSALVRDACFAVSCPNYQTGSAAALPGIPHLYYMDSVEGTDRDNRPVAPEFAVDVTPFIEVKREMLAAHASQRDWLMKQHGMDDYLRTMEEWTAARGFQYGVPYAEGFRQYKHHPYPSTPLLQDLVGDSLLG